MKASTRAFRLKELKTLVCFWKEQGVCMTVELESRVFRVALPCLARLPARPSKNGSPGQGDILAFLKHWCPLLLEENGMAWARKISVGVRDGRAPYCQRADTAAAILGLTSAVREELKIKTIGATDMGVKERQERRRQMKAVAKAEKRKAAGATPRAESLSRTKPWLAEGISRRTWERRRAKLDASLASEIERPETASDATSRPMSNVVTLKLPTGTKLRHVPFEAGASVSFLFGGMPAEPSQEARREDGVSSALLIGGGA